MNAATRQLDGPPAVSQEPLIPADRFRRLLHGAGIAALFLIYFFHQFPEYLAGNIKYVAMAVQAALFMLVIVVVCFDRLTYEAYAALARRPEALGKRAMLVGMVALGTLSQWNKALLDHHFYFQARIVTLPLAPANLALWTVMAGAALWLLVRPPRTYTPILLLALIWGVLLRLLTLRAVPYTPDAADMLFCIDRATAFALQGVNPYLGQTCEVSPSHSFPLMYFPLLWEPYLPFKALGLDIRWFNLLAQVTLFGFVWKLIGRDDACPSRNAVLVLLIMMPDMVWSFFYRQLSHYWLLEVVFLWAVWRDRSRSAIACLAGMASMRITALAAVWIYLLYVWKRKGLKTAAVHGAAIALVFCVTMAPFLGAGLSRFKYLFFDSLTAFAAQTPWQKPLTALSAGGGLLTLAGHMQWTMPLQVGGLLLLGMFYRLSKDCSFRTFGCVTALAYAYFLSLSAFIAVYYWVFPILALATVWLLETQNRNAALLRSADVASHT